MYRGYGEVWGDAGRCVEQRTASLVSAQEMWGYIGRYGEIREGKGGSMPRLSQMHAEYKEIRLNMGR